MADPPTPEAIDPAEHRAWGVRTNGRVWELLELPARTDDETRELIDAAHASCWHWRQGGDYCVGEFFRAGRAAYVASDLFAVAVDFFKGGFDACGGWALA